MTLFSDDSKGNLWHLFNHLTKTESLIVQLHSHWNEEKGSGIELPFAAEEEDAAAASARNMLGELERGFSKGKKLE
jgi:hypothetical protein